MKAKRILSGVLSAAMVISALSAAPAATTAENDMDTFDDLNQEQIVYDMGAGWNVGNQLEASSNGTPSETAWVNTTITQSLISTVKAQGFNTVRIPISYLSKIGPAPSYTIDDSWMARIEAVVNYVLNEGMYAIINIHGDGYYTVDGGWLLCGESNQTEIKQKYKACWKQIAETFKDYDEHVIFESMNEVFDNTYNSDPDPARYANINAYNQIFVDTVRQTGGNNAKRWLLIPGWNTNINYTVGDYGFEIPTDKYRDTSIPSNEKRIMISVHYYDPWDFCGQEDGKVTTWGTEEQIETMKQQLTRCYMAFVRNGYPVVIGEYGSIDKTSYNSSNTESRVKYANELCRAARARGLVPVYWDNGWNGKHGFGLINRSNNQITQPEIINAIISAYEGDPDTFDYVEPVTKSEALGVINCTSTPTVLVSGKADASMAGATQIKYNFDCASDVAFNQYSNIVLTVTVNGTEQKATVSGNSDVTGATNLSATINLSAPLKAGDSYSIAAYTKSWKDAKDYVFLIRSVELINADGAVITTINKSNKPAVTANKKPAATTAKTTAAVVKKPVQVKKVKAVSNKKKALKVTWKKQSGVKGYIIQAASKKNFKKKTIVAKKTLKKNTAKVNLKTKKIKSGKKYFVRVRAYKTYTVNGVTKQVSGPWSKKVKSAKVK